MTIYDNLRRPARMVRMVASLSEFTTVKFSNGESKPAAKLTVTCTYQDGQKKTVPMVMPEGDTLELSIEWED